MTDGKLQSSHETIIVDDVVDVNVVNVVIIVDANIKPICNFAILSNIFSTNRTPKHSCLNRLKSFLEDFFHS